MPRNGELAGNNTAIANKKCLVNASTFFDGIGRRYDISVLFDGACWQQYGARLEEQHNHDEGAGQDDLCGKGVDRDTKFFQCFSPFCERDQSLLFKVRHHRGVGNFVVMLGETPSFYCGMDCYMCQVMV